jgi:hypothetical protein
MTRHFSLKTILAADGVLNNEELVLQYFLVKEDTKFPTKKCALLLKNCWFHLIYGRVVLCPQK